MPTLYRRLFTYRERPLRAPKEDFLSEALAHLLSYMPPDVINKFVKELLLPPGEPQQAWENRFGGNPDGRWKTQFPIQQGGLSGRLDISYMNNNCLLIIENKIDARAGNEQLNFYREWMAGQNQGGWPGAICLLTHTAEAPAGFAANQQGNGAADGPYQRICRWSEVYKWLKANGSYDNATLVAPWRVFAKELSEYLREEGMCSEYVSEYDIAAGCLFIKSGEKFRNFFQQIYLSRIRNNTLDIIQNHVRTIHDREPYQILEDRRVIWDWVHLRPPYSPPNQNDWYIAWGLWFPTNASVWNDCNPPLPDTIHALVVWESDVNHYVPQHGQIHLPDGWQLLAEGGAIAARKLSEFPSDPDQLVVAFGVWVQEKIVQLLPVIEGYVQPAPPAPAPMNPDPAAGDAADDGGID